MSAWATHKHTFITGFDAWLIFVFVLFLSTHDQPTAQNQQHADLAGAQVAKRPFASGQGGPGSAADANKSLPATLDAGKTGPLRGMVAGAVPDLGYPYFGMVSPGCKGFAIG